MNSQHVLKVQYGIEIMQMDIHHLELLPISRLRASVSFPCSVNAFLCYADGNRFAVAFCFSRRLVTSNKSAQPVEVGGCVLCFINCMDCRIIEHAQVIDQLGKTVLDV